LSIHNTEINDDIVADFRSVVAYELKDGHMGVSVTLPRTGAPEDVFRVTPSTSFWTFLSECLKGHCLSSKKSKRTDHQPFLMCEDGLEGQSIDLIVMASAVDGLEDPSKLG